jgi:hypothetical protein
VTGNDIAITSKDELLDYTRARWIAFTTLTDALADEQWTAPVDPAGWSAKDHVAHVTDWDVAVIEQLRSKTPPQLTLEISDEVWASGTDAINDALRQRTIGESVEMVKTRRDRVWAAFFEALTGLSEADLAGPGDDFHLADGDKPLLEVLVGWQGGHYDHHGEYIAAIVGH